MNSLLKLGRLFYGLGIVALGVHQLITRSFRPDILPWALHDTVFPILAGIALILAGIVVSGLVTIRLVSTRRMCLYLAFCFLVLIITCHLPYLLSLGFDKLAQLQFWFGVGETLAYCGGALLMANSFPGRYNHGGKTNAFDSFLERLIPFGTTFYAILILIFGCSHFVYTASVSTMVPKWFGASLFWTYFVGVALIGAAVAIIFKLWVRVIARLLAIMLFLFFLLFHVPDAIANPSVGGGNEIARGLVALLFCGIALVIVASENQKQKSLL